MAISAWPGRAADISVINLLSVVQDLIVKLYDLERDLPSAERFVIGDEGFRWLYRNARIDEVVRSGSFPARVLLRPAANNGLRLAIYLPDEIVDLLERHNPMRSLDERNIDALSCFVEEIDHFLVIASKWARGRPLTLLELELHANVTKHFVTRHFLRRQLGGLPERASLFLAYHLFHKREFSDPDETVRERYQAARRLGIRYLQHLQTLGPTERLRELRSWSDASPQAKVAHITHLAAALPSRLAA